MGDIVIGQGSGNRRPPRLVVPVGLASLAILGLVFFIGRAGDEIPGDFDLAATTIPLSTTSSVPQRSTPGLIEYSQADLLDGDPLTWEEIPLPTGLTAAFAVGELAGQPAVVGTTRPWAGVGYPGASLAMLGSDGRWKVTDVAGADRFVREAHIGPVGVTIVVASGLDSTWAPRSTEAVHSGDGLTWTTTPLVPAGEGGWIQSVSVVADARHTLIAADVATAPPADVVGALPAEAAALLDMPFTWLGVQGDRVEVSFGFGFPLYRSTRSELGLDPGVGTEPQTRVVAWLSDGADGFVELPEPLSGRIGDTLVGGPAYGFGAPATGLGFYALGGDVERNVLYWSEDGRTWEGTERPTGRVSRFILGLDDQLFGPVFSNTAQVEVLRMRESAAQRLILDAPGAGTLSVGATGPFGLAYSLLDAKSAPIQPLVVEDDGVRFEIATSSVIVETADQSHSFGLWGDIVGLDFDLDARQAVFSTQDGSELARLPLTVLVDAFVDATTQRLSGRSSIVYTPDGFDWTWSAVPGGDDAGLIGAVAVGEERILALTGEIHALADGSPISGPTLWSAGS